jgi:hypothetical protein
VAFYIPHDYPYCTVDRHARSIRYPSPPAYGLACDLAGRIKRAIARMRTASCDENSSVRRENAAPQPGGLLPPNGPF